MKQLLAIFVVTACVACGTNADVPEKSRQSTSACEQLGLKLANAERCAETIETRTSPIVRVSDYQDSGSLRICSGVAISPSHVLTAAHCVTDNSSKLRIESASSVHEVSKIHMHPHFQYSPDGTLLFFDIAVVELQEGDIEETVPLLLSRPPREGERSLVAGYGFDENETLGRPKAGVTYVKTVTDHHLLTRNENENSTPCQGDSGGPLLVEEHGTWVLAGIVSQSDPSTAPSQICKHGDVILYTNVHNPGIANFLLSLSPAIAVR